MCANKFEKSEKYSGTRESFDELGVEEQAVFIVESAFNMVVQGVKKAGDTINEAFEGGAESEEENDLTEDGSEEQEAANEQSKSAQKGKKTAGKAKKKSPKEDAE